MVGDAVGPCAATRCRVERITTTAPVKVRLPHWWRFRRRTPAVEIGVIAGFPCSASSRTSRATLFPSPALIAQVPQHTPTDPVSTATYTNSRKQCTEPLTTCQRPRGRRGGSLLANARSSSSRCNRSGRFKRRVTPTSPRLVTVFGHLRAALHTRGTTARKKMNTSHPCTRRPSTHAGYSRWPLPDPDRDHTDTAWSG